MAKDKVFSNLNNDSFSGVIGLASPKDRLAAFVLDCVLLLPIVQIFQAPVRRNIFNALLLQDTEQVGLLRFYNLIIFFILFVLYYTVMTYWRGQTIGKIFFKVKVISYQGSLSLWQSFIRSLNVFAELVLMGLPFLALFNHSLRRPIHDRISDTLVISLTNPVGFPSPKEKLRAKWAGAIFGFLLVVSGTSLVITEEDVKMRAAQLILNQESCEEKIASYDKDIESLTALYLNREISDKCLFDEARAQLWKNQDSADAKFALALALNQEKERSHDYLNDVCTDEPTHSLCLVSDWLITGHKNKEFDISILQNQLQHSEKSQVAQLLLVRFLLEENQFEPMLKLLKDFRPTKAFLPLYTAMSFQALLGNLNWSEAYWLYQSQPHLDDEDLITFIFWDNGVNKFSIKQKMELLEMFYPGLKTMNPRTRMPASVSSDISVEIKEVYEFLEGQL